MTEDTNNLDIVLNYISEIEKDHLTFREERISNPISVKRLTELIKEKEYKINAVDAMAVLQIHAKSCQKILSESFAKRMLEYDSIRTIIKHRRFLFSVVGTETAKESVLKRLMKLDSDKINDLVLALKKNPNI